MLKLAQVAADLALTDGELGRKQLLPRKAAAVLAGIAGKSRITELGAGGDQARSRKRLGHAMHVKALVGNEGLSRLEDSSRIAAHVLFHSLRARIGNPTGKGGHGVRIVERAFGNISLAHG